MANPWRRVYGVIILLSVLSAAGIAMCRLSVERANNTVGIMVDYYATRDLSIQTNRALSDTLGALKESGVWGVGLEELTVNRAAREGLLMLFDGLEAGPALQAMGLGVLPVRESSAYVVWWPATTPQWLAHALRMHLWPWSQEVANERGLLVWEIPAGDPGEGHANRPVVAATVGNVGLGLSETAVRAIRQAGLQVVPRFRHDPTLNEQQVRWRLRQIAPAFYDGVPVVFAGQRIPGSPDLLPEWISGLQSRHLPLGLIEFAPQTGDKELARALGYQGIRLHTINAQELLKIDPQVAVERWERAVRERDVRMLYVRPLPAQNPFVQQGIDEHTPLDTVLMQRNLEYVRQIAQAVRKGGYELGKPAPFRPLVYPWLLLCFSAAGIALASWWLLTRVVYLPERYGPWLAAGVAVVYAIGYLSGHGSQLSKVLALVAAVVFPTVAIMVASDVAETRHGVLKGFWLASAISLLGALHVVAMLGDVRFMLKVDQFVGVKLAHVAPPVLIVLGILLGPLPLALGRGGEGWQRLRNLVASQVPVKVLLGVALVGLTGLVYVLRTGNDLLPVLALEQTIRRTLESLLVVRPRSKELFFGHPLLVAALHQKGLGKRKVAAWLMVGAVVGQLSILNTFSHIHTPLLVSLWRTVSGLVLGFALGWIVVRPLVAWIMDRVGEVGEA